jgi:hypothetical protein
MSDNSKIYCGNGKMGKAAFFQLKMYFHVSDVELLLCHAQTNANGLVCLDISERRKPSEKGTTHYGVINTWKPNSEQAPAPSQPAQEQAPEAESKSVVQDDLPF